MKVILLLFVCQNLLVNSLDLDSLQHPDRFNLSKRVDVSATATVSTPSVSISNSKSQSQSVNSYSVSSSNNVPTPSNNGNQAQQQASSFNDGITGNGMRNKPILSSLLNRLEVLASKLDRLGEAQLQIQKSFNVLESRYTLSPPGIDEVPQCGRRVDRVLRTLTPLVSRVEGLWNIVSSAGKVSDRNLNVSPSQFLSGPPPADVLLSESRRQERAISAIKSDLNIRSQQIMAELGTVEHQLDLLQTNLHSSSKESQQQQPTAGGGIPPAGSQQPSVLLVQPTTIDQADQLATDIQNNNDVTFSSEPGAVGTTTFNGTFRVQGVPAVVFPSVKNKPTADAATMDGAEALLSGSGATGNSCAELLQQGHRRSGLYHLRLPGARSSFWQLLVHCDQDSAGGGWMVIQRRADFGEPRESFNRNWVEYRSGFGDPVREVWMGNVNLHLLTTAEDQILRIELEDFDGEKRYAEYSTFRVASESDGFRLEVGGYSGDAGDALSDPWYGAHGSAFSTHDRDNDRSSLNCASMLKGGWWWKSCGRGLNGLYFDTQQPDSALARQGIVWFRWKGWDYTLKRATMMIRPKSFRPFNGTGPAPAAPVTTTTIA